MSKAGLIVLLGLLLTALPFIGVPTGLKTLIAVVASCVVMALGILVREERRLLIRALKGDHAAQAYTENSAQGYESAHETPNPA